MEAGGPTWCCYNTDYSSWASWQALKCICNRRSLVHVPFIYFNTGRRSNQFLIFQPLSVCICVYICTHLPATFSTTPLQQQIPNKVSKLFKLCVLSWEMLFCRHCKEPLEPCNSYSIASNQSEHFNLWPLTWARHLSSQVQLNGYILNFGTILCEPLETVVWEVMKIQAAVCETLWPASRLAPSTFNTLRFHL